MALIHLAPEDVDIPMIADLGSFRDWALSGEFPERGRIDWLAGRIEVDMSPEDVTSHGTVKNAQAHELTTQVEHTGRGFVVTDRTRYTSPSADLSCEPDVLVVLFESIEAGRVRLVPKATGEAGRYVEISGTADLVAEVVSDSSEEKDTKRLRKLYYQAGVPEYWLTDVRGGKVRFSILVRGPRAYSESPASSDGWVWSPLLAKRVRLVRLPAQLGIDRFRVETRPGRPGRS